MWASSAGALAWQCPPDIPPCPEEAPQHRRAAPAAGGLDPETSESLNLGDPEAPTAARARSASGFFVYIRARGTWRAGWHWLPFLRTRLRSLALELFNTFANLATFNASTLQIHSRLSLRATSLEFKSLDPDGPGSTAGAGRLVPSRPHAFTPQYRL
ncbi:uncharacterized protein LOC115064679 [Mus pahari]|uniref:uncharacterized protein LOC115064679 n=1 Tax=Mus pahari TaxID=10093 RepID=UPI001114B743|nr:uncharacterized protein LOC115064679 [Mus pahari]